MTRTPEQMAEVLTTLYNEDFKDTSDEGFQILWPDFRALAGGRKINAHFLNRINKILAPDNFVIAPFERFLALVSSSDLSGLRKTTGRTIEQYMPDPDEDLEIDDDEIHCADDTGYLDEE